MTFARLRRNDGIRPGRAAADKLTGGITAYSNTDWQELFAESFALYVNDPNLFRVLRPNLYQYFATKFPLPAQSSTSSSTSGVGARPGPGERVGRRYSAVATTELDHGNGRLGIGASEKRQSNWLARTRRNQSAGGGRCGWALARFLSADRSRLHPPFTPRTRIRHWSRIRFRPRPTHSQASGPSVKPRGGS